MAAPELHLRATDRGAKNVHSGDEVVAHGIHAAPDQFQKPDDDVDRWLGRRFRLPPRYFAHGSEQDAGDVALALHANRAAARFAGHHQTVDKPGARGVQLGDAGKIDGQRHPGCAFGDIAHLCIDMSHGQRGPDAGKRADKAAVALAQMHTRGLRVIS